MTHIIVLFLLAFLFFFLAYSSYKKNKSPKKTTPDPGLKKILEENEDWITERWNRAKKERDQGDLTSVPKWYFHEATKQQKERIRKEGYDIREDNILTKGEATDIIGLFEPVSDRDKEVLEFFEIPLEGMNRSRAQYEVSKLFSNPANVERWENRPKHTDSN